MLVSSRDFLRSSGRLLSAVVRYCLTVSKYGSLVKIPSGVMFSEVDFSSPESLSATRLYFS